MASKKVYVTMTDNFLSGWGMAEGKINKYILECDSREEAEIVAENAGNRSEMKNISITYTKPYYSPKRYLMSFSDKQESPNWYKRGYFQKEA